jgi:hypothetical protein
VRSPPPPSLFSREGLTSFCRCKKLQHFRLAKITILLHVVVFGAVPLIIIGILKLYGGDDKTLSRILIAIGLAILFQVYIVQTLLALYASSRSEKPLSYLAFTIFAMAPLLLLRLIYATLAFFVTSSTTFSPVQGSLVAQVLMSVVPENGIALLAVGWGLLMLRGEAHIAAYKLTSYTTS